MVLLWLNRIYGVFFGNRSKREALQSTGFGSSSFRPCLDPACTSACCWYFWSGVVGLLLQDGPISIQGISKKEDTKKQQNLTSENYHSTYTEREHTAKKNQTHFRFSITKHQPNTSAPASSMPRSRSSRGFWCSILCWWNDRVVRELEAPLACSGSFSLVWVSFFLLGGWCRKMKKRDNMFIFILYVCLSLQTCFVSTFQEYYMTMGQPPDPSEHLNGAIEREQKGWRFHSPKVEKDQVDCDDHIS